MSENIGYKSIPALTVYEVRGTAAGMGPKNISP